MKRFKLAGTATVTVWAEVKAMTLEQAIEDAQWKCSFVDGDVSDVSVFRAEDCE